MFRIKNTRNATVVKQSHLTPAPLRPAPPIHVPLPQRQPLNANSKAETRPLPPRELVRKNENMKLKVPLGQHKIVITTKPHQNAALIKKPILQIKNDGNPKKVEIVIVNKDGMDAGSKEMAHNAVNCHHSTKAQAIESQVHSFQKQTCSQELKIKQKHIREQREAEEEFQRQELILKEQEERRRKEEREEQRKREEAQARRRREEERREEQAREEAKLREMTEKVNARRKARQEEQERRIKFEKEMESQQQVGGIVALSDALAHVEMSEAMMDKQVNMLLSMKFAGFPNQEALERQVEELERINRSYLLVRTDPNNPLIRGLSNFRVELFNRVGELVMQAQTQLGPAASGLQLIQADSRNYPQLKGLQVTRGLEGHLGMLRKSVLGTAEECAICLGEVEAGRSVYDVACGHKFHERCLEDWLNTNANCPACRYNIKFDHT